MKVNCPICLEIIEHDDEALKFFGVCAACVRNGVWKRWISK